MGKKRFQPLVVVQRKDFFSISFYNFVKLRALLDSLTGKDLVIIEAAAKGIYTAKKQG